MRIAFAFTLLSCWLPAAVARADTLKSDFLAQYAPCAKKLEHFYGKVTMRGTLTKTRGAEIVSVEECTLYSDGTRSRIDVLYREDVAADPGVGKLRAAVAAPESSFVVTRNAERNAFVLDNLSNDARQLAQVMRSQRPYLFAPYIARGGVSVLTVVNERNFTVTAVDEETESDGTRVVKVSYRNDTKLNGKPWPLEGWYSFLKDQNWALRGSLRRAPGGVSEFRSHITYEGEIEGVPLLRSAEYTQDVAQQRPYGMKFEVAELVPGAVPAEEFQLASFGIGDVRQEKESGYWLILIVVGVAALAFAFVVARLFARRQFTDRT